jgi:hypothetical protein
MLPREERDALAKTLQDTILQNVPGALEESIKDDALAYKSPENGGREVFCVLLVERDRLELQFPECPGVAASDGRFEKMAETGSCRLVIRKRTDLPGEILNAAIQDAAGIA